MNKSELNIMLTNGGGVSSHGVVRTASTTSSGSSSLGHSSHIPVPKSPCPKLQERIAGLKPVQQYQLHHHHQLPHHQQYQHQPINKPMSVAAQRAAFEKLDAAASSGTASITLSANSPSPSSIVNSSSSPSSSSGRLMRLSSGGSGVSHQLIVGGAGSSPRPESPLTSSSSSSRASPKLLDRSNSFQEASRWKSKYEEAEKRRKLLLQKSEAG